MKQGFTLIELVIALAISSLVGLSLYQMFMQTSKIVREIAQVIRADTPIYPLYNQLHNDITGMFAPRATVNFYLKKLADEEQKKAGPVAQPNKNEPPKPSETKDEEKKEDKTLKNIFFVETKETGYLFLSFITTAGISFLDAKGTLLPNDFIRRVAYVIQESPSMPGTLTLTYKVSNQDLNMDAIRKADFYPAYKVLEGIKKFSIEFTIFEPVSPEDKGKAPGSSKVVLKEWKEEDVFKKYKALIPAYITIKGEYTDGTTSSLSGAQRLYPFEFSFKVYGYNNYELPPKPPGKPPVAPSKDKPQQSGNTMDKISKFFEGTFGTKK